MSFIKIEMIFFSTGILVLANLFDQMNNQFLVYIVNNIENIFINVNKHYNSIRYMLHNIYINCVLILIYTIDIINVYNFMK